jgi:UDP-glucose 4-epimerase
MQTQLEATGRPIAVVLGAAGFIGRHVALALNHRGFAVRGLGHGNWDAQERASWGVTDWLESDIKLDSLNRIAGSDGIAAILQCAGSGAVSFSYSEPMADYQRSVDSTLAMLEFVRERSDSPRVVVASSAAVYGDQGDIDTDESAVRSPISPYGFHKMMAEILCDSYSRFFGVTASVVRLFSVYGEGLRKQLLWDALNKFDRDEFRFFGTGHEWRDWIHVDDAASLLVAAATADQPRFAVYNGGHDKATTRDVLTSLASLSGAAGAVTFTGKTHTGNPRRLTASCFRARHQLGWEPHVALAQGLPRYVDWYRAQAASQAGKTQ